MSATGEMKGELLDRTLRTAEVEAIDDEEEPQVGGVRWCVPAIDWHDPFPEGPINGVPRTDRLSHRTTLPQRVRHGVPQIRLFGWIPPDLWC